MLMCKHRSSLESGCVRKQVIYGIYLQSQKHKMWNCSRTVSFHNTEIMSEPVKEPLLKAVFASLFVSMRNNTIDPLRLPTCL